MTMSRSRPGVRRFLLVSVLGLGPVLVGCGEGKQSGTKLPRDTNDVAAVADTNTAETTNTDLQEPNGNPGTVETNDTGVPLTSTGGVAADNAAKQKEAASKAAMAKLKAIGGSYPPQLRPDAPPYTIETLTSVSFFSATMKITDDDVAFVTMTFPNLREIDLSGQHDLTDKSAEHVAALTQLTRLQFESNHITDTGVKLLANLTNLEDLSLSGASISDEVLSSLSGLTKLKRLSLYRSSVSDAGLKHLEPLKNLEQLTLGGSRVTESGVAALKKALPNCGMSK